MIVLGIDPGTQRVGFGVVETKGASSRCLAAGTIRVSSKDHYRTLLEIERGVDGLIAQFHPDRSALERLFFSKNQKTALSVAEARGVILSSLLRHRLPVAEYAPNEVKLRVAGYGFADKKAVEKMVKLILRKPDLRLLDDAVDALAIALCDSMRARLGGVPGVASRRPAGG